MALAFASMRAVRLFLRGRAVVKFVLRAASALGNTDGVQRTLFKCFSPAGISLLSEGNSVLHQVVRVIWLTPPIQDNRRNRGPEHCISNNMII